jgi:hypothetical protein
MASYDWPWPANYFTQDYDLIGAGTEVEDYELATVTQ